MGIFDFSPGSFLGILTNAQPGGDDPSDYNQIYGTPQQQPGQTDDAERRKALRMQMLLGMAAGIQQSPGQAGLLANLASGMSAGANVYVKGMDTMGIGDSSRDVSKEPAGIRQIRLLDQLRNDPNASPELKQMAGVLGGLAPRTKFVQYTGADGKPAYGVLSPNGSYVNATTGAPVPAGVPLSPVTDLNGGQSTAPAQIPGLDPANAPKSFFDASGNMVHIQLDPSDPVSPAIAYAMANAKGTPTQDDVDKMQAQIQQNLDYRNAHVGMMPQTSGVSGSASVGDVAGMKTTAELAAKSQAGFDANDALAARAKMLNPDLTEAQLGDIRLNGAEAAKKYGIGDQDPYDSLSPADKILAQKWAQGLLQPSDLGRGSKDMPAIIAGGTALNGDMTPELARGIGNFRKQLGNTQGNTSIGAVTQNMNRAIPHLNDLLQTGDKLPDTGVQVGNWALNKIGGQGLGNYAGALSAYNSQLQLVAGEAQKLASGQVTQGEIKEIMANLSPNATKEQRHAAIGALAQLQAQAVASAENTKATLLGPMDAGYSLMSAATQKALRNVAQYSEGGVPDMLPPSPKGGSHIKTLRLPDLEDATPASTSKPFPKSKKAGTQRSVEDLLNQYGGE